jgi:hypothetical protein
MKWKCEETRDDNVGFKEMSHTEQDIMIYDQVFQQSPLD